MEFMEFILFEDDILIRMNDKQPVVGTFREPRVETLICEACEA